MIKGAQLGKSPKRNAMFQRISEKPGETRRDGTEKLVSRGPREVGSKERGGGMFLKSSIHALMMPKKLL
jgi:hypothetical protein